MVESDEHAARPVISSDIALIYPMDIVGGEPRSSARVASSLDADVPSFFTRLFRRLKHRRDVVLFGWELGGGLGHVHRLLAIAAEFSARDSRLVFALRRPENADAIRQQLPAAKVLRAPVHVGEERNATAAFNFADILHRCGYDDVEHLGPVVSRWRELIDIEKPSLVVCDHSPTLILAAAGRLPVVNVGSGFATPPPGRPFLTLFPAAAKGAKQRELDVLRAINEVHERLATPKLDRVCDLFSFAENIACCLPELDPYQRVRKEPAIGPVEKLPQPEPIGETQFIFGYLNGSDPSTARIIESLAGASVPCGLYVHHCPPHWSQLVAGSAVTLFPTPQKMPDALASATAVVHHGGSMAQTALALGRPQLLFPRTLDQLLMAEALAKMGCGINLGSNANPGGAIRRALTCGLYRKESAAAAGRIAARPAIDVKAHIIARCGAHLA